jgi:hypothetical protein
MATQKPPQPFAQTSDQAVFFKGIQHILGTGWGKTAGVTKIGG